MTKKRDIDRWICKDCGKDTFLEEKDYYMVRKDLWKEFGVEKGMLCIHCFEERLGRSLVMSDMTDCFVNRSNQYVMNLKPLIVPKEASGFGEWSDYLMDLVLSVYGMPKEMIGNGYIK